MSQISCYFKASEFGYIKIKKGAIEITQQLALIVRKDFTDNVNSSEVVVGNKLVYYLNMRKYIDVILEVDIVTENNVKWIALFLGSVIKVFVCQGQHFPKKSDTLDVGDKHDVVYRDDWIKVGEFEIDKMPTASAIKSSILESLKKINIFIGKVIADD